MKRWALIFAAAALIVSAPTSTYAGTIYCDGTISKVLLYNDGRLMIVPSYRNDFLSVCNVQVVWNNIDTATCWGWYSILMTAKKEAKQVTVYYDSSAVSTCALIPTYGNSPAPGYVMINE
jgi:hypothetical protein